MLEAIQKNRKFFIFEGILFIVLGILAIALPGIFTLGFEQLIGCLFLISGVVQGYRSFTMFGNKGWFISTLISALYIFIGILLLIYPIPGILTLTVLLTAFFLLDGIAKIVFASELLDLPNKGWLIVSGVLSLGMALLIWLGWPSTALWVIGLLIGVNLLFFGISLLSIIWATPKE